MDTDLLEYTCEMWSYQADGTWKVEVFDGKDEQIDERTEDRAMFALWEAIGAGMAIRYQEPEQVQKMRDTWNRRKSIKLVVDNST